MCLGIPGQIEKITQFEQRLARVRIGEVTREVNIACVCNDESEMDALVGKWVLIHVGFAMAIIDEKEAMQTLSLLQEWADIKEELTS